MKQKVFYLALLAAIHGVSGCSTAPEVGSTIDQTASQNAEGSDVQPYEVIPEPTAEASSSAVAEKAMELDDLAKQPILDGYSYSTDLIWTTVTQSQGMTASTALESAGLDATWIAVLSKQEAELLERRFEGISFHVIHDEVGTVQELYGLDAKDQATRIQCMEVREPLDLKGFVAETKISLSINPRSTTERLGKPQQMALKRLMAKVAEQGDDQIRAFQEGEVSLSFKALFIDGKLAGPTRILEAKTDFEGKEITFPGE